MFLARLTGRGTDHDQHSTTERITRPARIAATLQRLMDGRCLADLCIPGLDEHFTSAILRIYPARELIILDELNAAAGHEALVKAGRFRARCRLHGVEYRFASSLRRVERRGGAALYFADMPKLMLHIQRREHYRVPVDSTAGLEVQIPLFRDPKARPNLCDLSATGLGIRIATDRPLKQGQVLPACSLVLPTGKTIHTQVEVRFVRADRYSDEVRMGGHFVNLEARLQKQLTALIKRLERLYLRSHSH